MPNPFFTLSLVLRSAFANGFHFHIIGCFLLVSMTCHSVSMAQVQSEASRQTQQVIGKLISELGNSNFAIREKATRELKQIDEAIPALREAMKSPDNEIASRAEKILKELTEEIKNRPLRIAENLFKLGKVDWAIETLAQWRGSNDDPALWQTVLTMGWEIIDQHQKRANGSPVFDQTRSPARDYFEYQKQYRVVPVFLDSENPILGRESCYVFRGNKLATPVGMIGSLVVSSGPSQLDSLVSGFVLANDSMIIHRIVQCVVICDGDISITRRANKSLIVAKGKIICPAATTNSVLIASGNVEEASDKVQNGGNRMQSNEAKPFDFVQWFKPEDVGFQVEPIRDGVRILKLDDAKLPARSGLQVNDQFTSVDGVKIGDAESFRKLLRKGSVHNQCDLTLKRGEKTISVTLDFKQNQKQLLKETTLLLQLKNR